MNKKFIDYYPPSSNVLEWVRENILLLFKRFGYQIIEPSTFEDYEKLSWLNGQNSIKFIDSDGTIIALRNEFTPKVAEIATKIWSGMSPIKCCYFGKAYQFIQEEAGDLREFFQAGVENFHTNDSVYIDIEILVLAIETLLGLGINDFTIDIGEVNFFKGISIDYGIDDVSSEILCKLIDKKDYIGIENFLLKKGISDKVIGVFRSITRLYGKKDKIKESYKFAKNDISKSAIERLEVIFDRLSNMGYEKYISIDFGMLKHLNYYTGIIFAGYLPNLGYPILNGGRYDDLCKAFGKHLYAIGFAFGIDRIISWLIKGAKIKIQNYEIAFFFDEGYFEKAIYNVKNLNHDMFFYSIPVNIEEALHISRQLGINEFYYLNENGIMRYRVEELK